jgi:hypothetical protein
MVGAALSGGAERVRVLLLPGLAEKGDASDWLAAGGTADDWHRLVEKTARPFGEHLPAIPTTGTAKILTSRQFVEGFVPPDYAIDGIAQKSFIYSFTGQTGSGKTSILLLLAYLVATGRALGKHQIDRGKVLILAGENPTDARQRWIAMAAVLGFNLDEIDVYFIDGRFKIEELYDTVAAQVEALGGVALILVDTSAAFFEGEDENNNSQIGKHATMLRRLTTLKGGPCVLVACHPVKKAAGDNLLPRGGGAFLAEMDGNFTATERDGVVEFHWQGKLRGPDFDPIIFKLDAGVKCERLKDAKGRMILTVIARVLNADERAELERGKVRDEDAVLIAMLENPSASLRGIASKLGWFNNGEPDGTKVHRNATKLGAKDQGLTKQDRKQTWILTEKGKKEAEKLQFNRDAGKRERDD